MCILLQTGSLEGQYKKKTGQLISFSEQQLLECKGNGCDAGGWVEKAFDYIKENGIEGGADYPYVGTVEKVIVI
jgi:cathepsin L